MVVLRGYSDMYVTRRRNRVLRKTNQAPLDPAKSNPSKRHRERLNGELEYLASLLPYEDSVIAKLDKLSILRLAVSYLRAKSYFRALLPVQYPSPASQTSDNMLKAMNGFLIVIDPNGEVFYASETVEHYLGFHQSDILHQSVLELVHSEDRENLSQQLNWNNITDINAVDQSNSQHLLRRSFIVRFRCLLDNTSGFITMEISGHLQHLYGQKNLPGVSLFAVCTPFGPIPIGDFNLEDITFRTKHKLDMSLVSVDPRGKSLLGDVDSCETRIYNLLHPQDITYFSNAHREMLKTGSSGLVAYRIMGKEGTWLWLQTSARVVYRNSKADYLMCFHRNLTEEEGSNLLGKRDIEFAMPQLHADYLLNEDVEEMPRSSKPRKSRKTTLPVQDTETRQYSTNHCHQRCTDYTNIPLHSALQGFGHSAILPSTSGYPCEPQQSFLDTYSYFPHDVQRGYDRQHYWDYVPHHSLIAAGEKLPKLDQHQDLNTGNIYHSQYNLYPEHYWAGAENSGQTEKQMSRLYHSTSTSLPQALKIDVASSPTILPKNNVNSNPLLSFTEMTFPLLNH